MVGNRVYQGRFKGRSETHMPNDEFREKFDDMKWDSFVPYKCPCGYKEYVHKLEQKIHRCSKCGE